MTEGHGATEEAWRAFLSDVLGSPVLRVSPLGGGSIHPAYRVRLQDGRSVFVKSHEQMSPPQLFACEARGLRWLAEAAVLRIPQVLWAGDAEPDRPGLLVLEYIEPARAAPGPRAQEDLGRALAALHQAGAPGWGLSHDNYLAALRQDNRSTRSWAEFYGERRLLPMVQRACERGVLDRRQVRAIEECVARLPALVGPEEQPARLHGDLWAGNLLWDTQGQPVLIDPAVYGGHREVDLAMMRLFGGFGARCFTAYAEFSPLAPGHLERIPLYQLYPLLVHVVLFGRSYISQLEGVLAQLPS